MYATSEALTSTKTNPAPAALSKTAKGPVRAPAKAPAGVATKVPARRAAMGDATDIYLSEIGGPQLLSADEEKTLATKVQAGDMQARGQMIESNLRLVVKIARRYLNRGLPL